MSDDKPITFGGKSFGPRQWPLHVSKHQRDGYEHTLRRGPRPDEVKLFKRIEAETIRASRHVEQHRPDPASRMTASDVIAAVTMFPRNTSVAVSA